MEVRLVPMRPQAALPKSVLQGLPDSVTIYEVGGLWVGCSFVCGMLP